MGPEFLCSSCFCIFRVFPLLNTQWKCRNTIYLIFSLPFLSSKFQREEQTFWHECRLVFPFNHSVQSILYSPSHLCSSVWWRSRRKRGSSERRNNLSHVLCAALSVARVEQELSIGVSMTTVEAAGNVLLPYRSLIHYELLVDGRLSDGECTIHHKTTHSLLAALYEILLHLLQWSTFTLFSMRLIKLDWTEEHMD